MTSSIFNWPPQLSIISNSGRGSCLGGVSVAVYSGDHHQIRVNIRIIISPHMLLMGRMLPEILIRIIIYPHMLLMGRMLPEILMARDTLIFLLQHLGFVINLKKSVLHPVKQIEFLGLVQRKRLLLFQREN